MDFPTNSLDSQQSLPSRGQTDDIATYVHTLERGEESWQIELQRWRVGWVNFGAEMSGSFRMFRNQQGTRGFVNLSPLHLEWSDKKTHKAIGFS